MKKFASILLCAGRGSRMGTRRLPKVCLPVAGTPAVNRTLRAYRKCGVRENIIVVGADPAEVMRTVVSEFPDALFACQSEPLGTGHAVMCGAAPLVAGGFEGAVFISVGDKVVEPAVIKKVKDSFLRNGADLSLAVSEKPDVSDMGRLALDKDGCPLGIVEAVEIRIAKLFGRLKKLSTAGREIDPAKLRKICLSELGAEKHLARLGAVLPLLDKTRPVAPEELAGALPADAGSVTIGGRSVSLKQALAGPPWMNESIYLVKADALERALELLKQNRRAGGEIYFTDIIHLLAQDGRGWKIDPVLIDSSMLVFGFNTPAQLMELEERVRRMEGKATRVREKAHPLGKAIFKRAGEWMRMFDSRSPAAVRLLREIYLDPSLCEAKRRQYIELLARFIELHGADRRVVIARSPGRLNLMGRHIDTEGGFVNMMTIDREALIAASPRPDDRVTLAGTDPAFGGADFTIGGELAALDWDDWMQYISSSKVRQVVASSRGSRANYVRAAVLRLQHSFKEKRLAGMDCVARCDIPSAAGMGESGAIIAAAIEAAAALNGIEMSSGQLRNLCAEGLWYVTAGDTDHSAGRLDVNTVAQVRFAPLELGLTVKFPGEWRAIICETHPETRLSLELKHMRAAEMRMGAKLLGMRFPRFEPFLRSTRDIDCARLGIRLSELYAMFERLPLCVKPGDLREFFPQSMREEVDAILATHEPPHDYRIREATLFGAAECARSQLFPSLLEKRDAGAIGRLMAASHRAERTAGHHFELDDAALERLIADLRSENPEQTLRAQLYMRSGLYGSGAPRLDRLAEALSARKGVIGVQLSGTGMGGVIMAIAESDSAQELVDCGAELSGAAGVEVKISIVSSTPGSGLAGRKFD